MYFFQFIRVSTNCFFTSKMVSFLTYVSPGQSILFDTEKVFVFVCYIELNSAQEKCHVCLFITYRKPYRQHLNLPNYMQLRLKSSRYSSRKMKILIYKLLNFKNLVSFPFVLPNYFGQEYQGLQYSRILFWLMVAQNSWPDKRPEFAHCQVIFYTITFFFSFAQCCCFILEYYGKQFLPGGLSFSMRYQATQPVYRKELEGMYTCTNSLKQCLHTYLRNSSYSLFLQPYFNLLGMNQQLLVMKLD